MLSGAPAHRVEHPRRVGQPRGNVSEACTLVASKLRAAPKTAAQHGERRGCPVLDDVPEERHSRELVEVRVDRDLDESVAGFERQTLGKESHQAFSSTGAWRASTHDVSWWEAETRLAR